jgi:hypothetical protein
MNDAETAKELGFVEEDTRAADWVRDDGLRVMIIGAHGRYVYKMPGYKSPRRYFKTPAAAMVAASKMHPAKQEKA